MHLASVSARSALADAHLFAFSEIASSEVTVQARARIENEAQPLHRLFGMKATAPGASRNRKESFEKN
jgi:hypothetical protein